MDGNWENILVFQIFIEANILRQFLTIHTVQIEYFPLYSGKNLWFFEYLQRNFYLWRSSKIFHNSEEDPSLSSFFFLNPKILCLRLRSIFNLRCNTEPPNHPQLFKAEILEISICFIIIIIATENMENKTEVTSFKLVLFKSV